MGKQAAYRIADLLGRDVFESDWEVDEIEVDITQAPSFVLGFGLRESVFFAVVVVPEFGDDKDVFALDEPFLDGALDALSCFVLVLVIVGAVEEAVACFDGLYGISSPVIGTTSRSSDSRCRLCRRPGQLALSKDRSLREACHGQRQA